MPPPVIGAPNGRPNEMDIAHLGGSPQGPTPARLVVAAGTGAGCRLSSWGLDNGNLLPRPLQQTQPLAGRDVKLLTLAPVLSPKLAVVPFVSAVWRDDHNLWLSSWQVFNDGSFATFVARMNARASQLGLTQTLYGETDPAAGAPAGGGISTPADQTRLWLFANQKPLFAQIAAVRSHAGCGSTALGAQRCYSIVKPGDSGYTGLEAWKGGNGGFAIRTSFDPYRIGADNTWGTADAGPHCVGSGCLVAQARRLERDMVVGLQQTGNRWAAADALFRDGFERQCTADRRGPGLPALDGVVDVGLDHVHDILGITVHVHGASGNFLVCSWQLSADVGQVGVPGCRSLALPGVAAGAASAAVPTRIDGSRLSTLQADGDDWTGHTQDGRLLLNLWRVGPDTALRRARPPICMPPPP